MTQIDYSQGRVPGQLPGSMGATLLTRWQPPAMAHAARVASLRRALASWTSRRCEASLQASRRASSALPGGVRRL